MHRTFHVLRLVIFDVDRFAFVMVNMDFQLDRVANIFCVYCVQLLICLARSCWWWIWVVELEVNLLVMFWGSQVWVLRAVLR